jgi:hypothetical protein
MYNFKNSSDKTSKLSEQGNSILINRENIIKNSTTWTHNRIKESLEKVIAKNNYSFIDSSFRWDCDDKFYYIYDTECYLFITDGKIETRCDRENVFSSGKMAEYLINTIEDIESAYKNFVYMTMEDEDNE